MALQRKGRCIKHKLRNKNLILLDFVGASSISKIESGYFHPKDENIERIAKALKFEPYKLHMFNHQKNLKELRKDIEIMPNKATNEEIKLAHRILSGVLTNNIMQKLYFVLIFLFRNHLIKIF